MRPLIAIRHDSDRLIDRRERAPRVDVRLVPAHRRDITGLRSVLGNARGPETARNRYGCRATVAERRRVPSGRRMRAPGHQRRTVVDTNGRARKPRACSGDSTLAQPNALSFAHGVSRLIAAMNLCPLSSAGEVPRNRRQPVATRGNGFRLFCGFGADPWGWDGARPAVCVSRRRRSPGAAGWPCSRSPGRRRPLRQAFSLPAVPCSGLLFPWRRIFQGFDPARLHQPVSPFLREERLQTRRSLEAPSPRRTSMGV